MQDKEETWRTEVVLQDNTENTMDTIYEILRKIKRKWYFYLESERESCKFFRHLRKKEDSENLTLIGHTEVKLFYKMRALLDQPVRIPPYRLNKGEEHPGKRGPAVVFFSRFCFIPFFSSVFNVFSSLLFIVFLSPSPYTPLRGSWFLFVVGVRQRIVSST